MSWLWFFVTFYVGMAVGYIVASLLHKSVGRTQAAGEGSVCSNGVCMYHQRTAKQDIADLDPEIERI